MYPPDTAKLVYSDLEFGKGNLLTGIASRLSQLGGERVDAREFDLSTLADHLKFNICVVDDQRKTVIEGRNLKDLRAGLIHRAQAAFASAEKSAAVSGPSPEEVKWTRGIQGLGLVRHSVPHRNHTRGYAPAFISRPT